MTKEESMKLGADIHGGWAIPQNQNVIMTKENDKLSTLRRLLDDEVGDDGTAIVYFNTGRVAERVARNLADDGREAVTAVHGRIRRDERYANAEGFRSKRYRVLLANDVATNVGDLEADHIVNYDMPAFIEVYTHRIARARVAATTFLTMHDTEVFYDLKQMLTRSNCPVPPELERHEASKVEYNSTFEYGFVPHP